MDEEKIMFDKPLNASRITPNFLNSILTNPTLYKMFKDDFDANREYFQNISKDEYLFSMVEFISSKFRNIEEELKEEESTAFNRFDSIIAYTRSFYDDFMLGAFEENPHLIFFTDFFKALYSTRSSGLKELNSAFSDLFDYIFSTGYDKYCKIVMEKIYDDIKGDCLSVKDFDILCNYVKNNIDGRVSMDIVQLMIKNHAYKTNHIFDRDVVKSLLYSVALDYMRRYRFRISLEYTDEITLSKDESNYDFDTATIYIDSLLVNTFISGNYVELFSDLFYKMDLFKDRLLYERNEKNLDTLRTLMNFVNKKVDLEKMYRDRQYRPYHYMTDLKASSFIKTLKFYRSLGVDLFSSYIDSQLKRIDFTSKKGVIHYRKEISVDILFFAKFRKFSSEKIATYLKKCRVLPIFVDEQGNRKRAIELLKRLNVSSNRELIISYLQTAIFEPSSVVEDVAELATYRSTSEEINSFVAGLLKYIFVDTFFYSLDGYIKLHSERSAFDVKAFLNELIVKIEAIKETEMTNTFKKSALKQIDEILKQITRKAYI